MNGLEFFGVGLPELITILLIAGLVMGPARIAKVARQLGEWTAQLQNISRGFMKQLTSELDASEAADLKDAMQELKDLRQELTNLRSEMSTSTSQTTRQLKSATDDIERSIRPPSLNQPSTPSTNGQPNQNGAALPPVPPMTPDQLPNILDIDDDPES